MFSYANGVPVVSQADRLELWHPKDALTEAEEELSMRDNDELCAHA